MITPQEMKELEDQAEAKGISKLQLMENAGEALYKVISDKYDLVNAEVVVFCGPGNNGGDGFVLARLLEANGYRTKVLFFGSEEKLTKESKPNYQKIENKVEITKVNSPEDIPELDVNVIMIDALLGTGTKGELREPIASGIDCFNESFGMKVSVDVPSGLDPLTGGYSKKCEADLIITFHDAKAGLKDLEDRTVIVDIGII